jgi:hypothetical protein
VFRSRDTDRITIVQFPNISLAVFIAASLLGLLTTSSGHAGRGLSGIATGALVVWAVDELARGVNPWRRALGGAMLASEVLHLLGR